MRFPLAVAAAVRDAAGPDMIVGFRITPFESEPGGYTLDESVELSRQLGTRRLDYIHISMDDFRKNSPQPEDRDWTKSPSRTESRRPISAIARAVGGRCAVVASGGIKSVTDAEQVLQTGADLIAIGRATLLDPDWLSKIRHGREHEVNERLPARPEDIECALTIPARMARYLVSRPGWIPRKK
jgi:2,4-dienoyl-CoA reductase-like NADH-dependent reductase (Old Yellow Enzyme family)